ncbi:MAG: DUF1015 domain-containing protein [Vulcanimicrobiota bacterium]
MSILRPFRALRPQAAKIEQIAAVPYDVVDRDEAQALAQERPLSFLHISRAEIDLDPELDPYSPQVYERARMNFQQLQQEGHLVADEQPCLYIYRLKMGDHVQTGIAATFSVDEYDGSLIKKHEKTRKAKEDDRTRHIIGLRSQTGPVFLTYRPRPGIDQEVTRLTASAPLYDFTAEDGVVHTVWRVSDCDTLVKEFAQLKALYIADGHHRAASASRARAALREEAGNWTGDEPANYFLAVAFPADQVQILPYNRILYDLGARTPAQFLEAVQAALPTTPGASPRPEAPGRCSLYVEGKWYNVALAQSAPASGGPAAKLDVAVLQAKVLEDILGIEDIRTDPRVDFVGGIRGTEELVRLVDSGKAKAAFSMYATSLDQLMQISDADEIMPPKSTWFEPKLRDGVVNHSI